MPIGRLICCSKISIPNQVLGETLRRNCWLKLSNVEQSAVLQYLHCQNVNDLSENFKILSNKESHALIKQLIVQWNLIPPLGSRCAREASKAITIQGELFIIIANSGKKIERCNSVNPRNIIQHELNNFDLTGQRGTYLNLIYNSLLTIPPTSVEAERSFSTAGRTKIKTRYRMSHELLDDLMILNRYFIMKDNNCKE